MPCCCPHSQSASKFFSLFAKSYRRRFNKKGFERSQRQLISGINKAGKDDKSLLEIGCGVGYLHQMLVEQGAKSALGVELSANMIIEAKGWARQRGLDKQLSYLEGDFIDLAEDINSMDMVIMDKVICCYPDAERLVQHSLEKCKQSIAVSYPRKTWYTRLGVQISATILKLFGSNFRPYIHDPELIETWILQQGFKKIFQDQTTVWLSQVYTRSH